MVLFDNNSFDQNGDLAELPFLTSKATTSASSSTKRSWAQVVTKNRKSLLLSSTTTPSTNTSDTINMKGSAVFKTSIWRHGHEPGSVFADTTRRKESKFEFLGLVAKQYPSRVGVITQQVGSMKFAEINFDSDDIALNDFLTNGIKFVDNSIIILCKALDSQMEVIYLRLLNLPFLGIQLEPTTRTYMCTGYAVLNVSSQHTKFKQLSHLIPWDEKRKQGFYAVWNQMPHNCRYCHEEKHVKVNCPKRRARTSCWIVVLLVIWLLHVLAINHLSGLAPTLLATTESPKTIDTLTIDVYVYPSGENQVPYDETLPHNPPVVIPIPLSTSTSSTTVSPGKAGPKCSRIHAAQKPYEHPVTRSQSVPPKEPI
ncbi:hypothetical protein G6F37_010589 [Rhizopus arrhizus]|nr:hypothetical protein G6F38_011731 [Rhizopus arrhizus]KAG1153180.1 hypothetical protein G6F37_010589 [Rhizopus arrhizus]